MNATQTRRRPMTGGGLRPAPSSALRTRVLGSAWTYRLIVLIVIGTLWELGARAIHALLVPTFLGTLGGVVQLLADPKVWGAFAISNQALVIGFALAVLLGIPLGLAAARFRRIEGFIDPYLNILLVTPMAALIPILLMSLGIGLASRVFLVVIFAIPVIIVNCRAGVRQVDPALIEMATSFGASERQVWRRILLPGALPAIMTGVRLGLGRGVTGMVIIELLMVSVGIGGLILNYTGKFQANLLYGVVVLVVLEALILVSAVRALERRIAPWSSQTVLRD
jgi:ABC-type nitrate/sulfonate/bicarbonate transport system permease component